MLSPNKRRSSLELEEQFERLFSFSSVLCAIWLTWRLDFALQALVSACVNLFFIAALNGISATFVEARAILSDILSCVHYLVSFGSAKQILSDAQKKVQVWPDNRSHFLHLRAAVQFTTTYYSYMFSYGPLCYTLRMFLHNSTYLILNFHWEDLYIDVLPAIFVAILYCVAVNVSAHRYFSHRSFRTSRAFRVVLAHLAAMSGQRGALWWASIHRKHHRSCGHSNHDPCKPKSQDDMVSGFLYAQCGWLLDRRHFELNFEEVLDWWQSSPELLCIEIMTVPICSLGQLLMREVFGDVAGIFGWSLSVQFEGLINSWCHTGTHACGAIDSFVVALLTGGEGFQLSHHNDPPCANHGWRWGALGRYLDLNYNVIRCLEMCGLVWDVRHPGPKNSPTHNKQQCRS
jgi:stearoyl-CoA desaturase (Delta-9 desaturase)